MTQDEYNALRATFPWTEQLYTVPGRRGGHVRVLDNRGQEVPLFTLTKFLQFITTKLAQANAAGNPSKEPQ